MATATPTLTAYSVTYRRDLSGRKYHVTVRARTADEARRKAAIHDPQYLTSIQVKNRGPVESVIVEVPTCFVCHKPITDDLYQRVDFGPTTGIQLVDDVCMERAS